MSCRTNLRCCVINRRRLEKFIGRGVANSSIFARTSFGMSSVQRIICDAFHQRFRAKNSMRLAIAPASITIPAKALNDLRHIAISSGVTVVMSKAPSAIGVKRRNFVLSILKGSSIGHGDAVDPTMRQSTPRRRRISPITQKVKASVARNCRGRPLPRTSMCSREIACSICGIDRPDRSAISAIPNVLTRPTSCPTICRIPTDCQDTLGPASRCCLAKAGDDANFQ